MFSKRDIRSVRKISHEYSSVSKAATTCVQTRQWASHYRNHATHCNRARLSMHLTLRFPFRERTPGRHNWQINVGARNKSTRRKLTSLFSPRLRAGERERKERKRESIPIQLSGLRKGNRGLTNVIRKSGRCTIALGGSQNGDLRTNTSDCLINNSCVGNKLRKPGIVACPMSNIRKDIPNMRVERGNQRSKLPPVEACHIQRVSLKRLGDFYILNNW